MKVVVETEYEQAFNRKVTRSERVNRILYRFCAEHQLLKRK